MVAFLPVAMVGPLFYALENTFVARTGMAGMDAVQAMFGASLAGLILCVPLMLVHGAVVCDADAAGAGGMGADRCLLRCMRCSIPAFVWLAARAGSVFAAQSSYIVTASGVVWAMLLLDERFSPWIWAAVVVMLAGLSLVQPRGKAAATV